MCLFNTRCILAKLSQNYFFYLQINNEHYLTLSCVCKISFFFRIWYFRSLVCKQKHDASFVTLQRIASFKSCLQFDNQLSNIEFEIPYLCTWNIKIEFENLLVLIVNLFLIRYKDKDQGIDYKPLKEFTYSINIFIPVI